jgi:hypothetical protein
LPQKLAAVVVIIIIMKGIGIMIDISVALIVVGFYG